MTSKETVTLDQSGAVMTIDQDGLSMPADYSFACVNDYVHSVDRHFEELQWLALGMANEIEKLRKDAELSGRVLDFALEYWRDRLQRPFDYADAYQGAREDLAIWKRRALEAERRVRKQDQIIDRMSDDLNAISGPTFMGEPVLLKRPEPDVSALVEALESAYHLISNHSGETLPTSYASDQMDMINAALAALGGGE